MLLEHGATLTKQARVCLESVVQVALFMAENHFISFKVGCGQETNNRAELNALWLLLKIAVEKRISNWQAIGDSKIIIDWLNGMSKSWKT